MTVVVLQVITSSLPMMWCHMDAVSLSLSRRTRRSLYLEQLKVSAPLAVTYSLFRILVVINGKSNRAHSSERRSSSMIGFELSNATSHADQKSAKNDRHDSIWLFVILRYDDASVASFVGVDPIRSQVSRFEHEVSMRRLIHAAIAS
jgi:hypothetical protein